ncbi:MAG TPA: hypothetical protein VJV97_00880, partial [Gemmatimonadaceae bacterium]|nr:hypothetical protein [Gemmatimonadaceae bacterium]
IKWGPGWHPFPYTGTAFSEAARAPRRDVGVPRVRALIGLGSVCVLACHAGPGEPATATRLLGAVQRSGDSIITTVTIVNELNRERGVAFAKCPPRNTVKLTLISGVAGSYRGTWDYDTMDSIRQLRRDFTSPACVPFSLQASLGPRSRVTSRFIAFKAADVLDDSLPDGRYAVWLFPRIVGRDPGGIPAGEIELRRR